MQTPQIVIIVLIAITLFGNLIKNGESKQYSFVTALIDSAILVGVLVWGGFFS
jgi:hypothetical protein